MPELVAQPSFELLRRLSDLAGERLVVAGRLALLLGPDDHYFDDVVHQGIPVGLDIVLTGGPTLPRLCLSAFPRQPLGKLFVGPSQCFENLRVTAYRTDFGPVRVTYCERPSVVAESFSCTFKASIHGLPVNVLHELDAIWLMKETGVPFEIPDANLEYRARQRAAVVEAKANVLVTANTTPASLDTYPRADRGVELSR